MFSSFPLDKKLVFYLIDTFESNTFSKNLIQQLNKHVHFALIIIFLEII